MRERGPFIFSEYNVDAGYMNQELNGRRGEIEGERKSVCVSERKIEVEIDRERIEN